MDDLPVECTRNASAQSEQGQWRTRRYGCVNVRPTALNILIQSIVRVASSVDFSAPIFTSIPIALPNQPAYNEVLHIFGDQRRFACQQCGCFPTSGHGLAHCSARSRCSVQEAVGASECHSSPRRWGIAIGTATIQCGLAAHQHHRSTCREFDGPEPTSAKPLTYMTVRCTKRDRCARRVPRSERLGQPVSSTDHSNAEPC